jgi:hypothetical protein
MVSIYIYVDGEPQKIDLFKDEKISVTQNITNYQDAGKLFADYSQTFTIPASPRNNQIFKHWYESAVQDGFDHRYRYDGFIEIATIPFKFGGFQLNGVEIKDRKVYSYKVTFFGKVKQIKDLFADDKLNVLDYSDLNHAYTPTEIYNRVLGAGSFDVYYPLIANDRVFTYNDASATDVTTNAGAVEWNKLFPAIRLRTVMDKIQERYGITFESTFFSSYQQYRRLWLYCKNAGIPTVYTERQKINFTSKSSGWDGMDLTNDRIRVNRLQPWTETPSGVTYDGNLSNLTLTITPASATNYRLLIFTNGTQTGTTGDLSGVQTIALSSYITNNFTTDYIELYVESQTPITYSTSLNANFSKFVAGTGFVTQFKTATSPSQTTISNIDIASLIPDIKVIDFFMGIVKMFNLVIIPTSETTFLIEPLEFWYSLGKNNNITTNVIQDSVQVNPPKYYKQIGFKYQKSENILNNNFRETFGTLRGYDYGDLEITTDFDTTTDTYTVELPFENVMYTRTGDFLTAELVNKDLQGYTPKPILMYDNNLQTVSPVIKFFNGITYDNITQYVRFSNELEAIVASPSNLLTLNWGEEFSPWYLTAAGAGLFQRQYQQQVTTYYDKATRVLSLKCIFKPLELAMLSLNDRVIYKDKKYTINSATADLTTGETSMELISDWRFNTQQIIGDEIGFRMSDIQDVFVDNDAVNVDINFELKDFDSFSFLGSVNGWLDYAPVVDLTEAEQFRVRVPANTTGVQRADTMPVEYKRGSESFYYYVNFTQDA